MPETGFPMISNVSINFELDAFERGCNAINAGRIKTHKWLKKR